MDKLWEVVKKVKKETSIQIDCASGVSNKVLYTESFIFPQIEAFEKQLDMNPSEITFENMTTEILENAGNMFVYLNYCPGNLKSWLVFYKDLFQNESPAQILLTLNRITQRAGSPQNKSFRNLGQTLLEKTASHLRSNWTTNAFLIKDKEIGKYVIQNFFTI